jgi:hypothetical protein
VANGPVIGRGKVNCHNGRSQRVNSTESYLEAMNRIVGTKVLVDGMAATVRLRLGSVPCPSPERFSEIPPASW